MLFSYFVNARGNDELTIVWDWLVLLIPHMIANKKITFKTLASQGKFVNNFIHT